MASRAEPQGPAIVAVPDPIKTSNQEYDKSDDDIDFPSSLAQPRFTHPSFFDNQFSSRDIGQGQRPQWPTSSNQASKRASQLSQPTFYDNQFESSELGNPKVFVQGPGGEQPRPPTDDDQRSWAPSRHSDFKSITTVEDFGLSLGMLVQNTRRQMSRGRASSAPALSGSERLLHPNNSLDIERSDESHGGEQNFRGLGDSFESMPELRASAQELEEELDDPDYLKLRDACVECKHDAHKDDEFVPLDELVKLLSETKIRQILRRVFPGKTDKIERLTHSIYSDNHEPSRRLILATLMLIDKVAAIEDFVHHDVRDVHLPLRQLKHRKVKFYKRDNSDPICFENWTLAQMGYFYTAQYQVLVPFLDMRKQHIHFYPLKDQKMILPFLEWEHKVKGGYGTVWKVKIHQGHHNFVNSKNPDDPNPYFAVKEIKSENYEAYRDEIRVLERFSGPQQGHHHLIRLLIAIQHATKYYLLFEWADGNLVDLWEQTQLCPSSPDDTRWLIRQCLGMAEGLMKIHDHGSWNNGDGTPPGADKNRGRHGDIKPENILCFKSPEDGYYHLVVSDFGLTRFHSAHSVSKVAHEKLTGWSWTYRPPEFDMHLSISQAYDMWSLGCLYLEFVSWFLVGYKETRNTFQDERLKDDIPVPGDSNHAEDKFFNLLPEQGRLGARNASHREPKVKDSVRDWIVYLQGHENCSQCTRDFLEIIKAKLLVPDPLKRAKIDTFHRCLEHILQSCESSSNGSSYCVPDFTFDRPASPASGQAMMPRATREDKIDHPDSLAKQILDQLKKSRGENDQEIFAASSGIDTSIEISGNTRLTGGIDREIPGPADDLEMKPLEGSTSMVNDDHLLSITHDEDMLEMDAAFDLISLQRDGTDTTVFESQLSQSGEPRTACTTPPLTTQNSEAETSMTPENVRRANLSSVSEHTTPCPTPDVMALANEQQGGLCIQLASPSGQVEEISGDMAVSNKKDTQLTREINNHITDEDMPRDGASLNPQPHSDEHDNSSFGNTTICPEGLERTSHQYLCHQKEFEAMSDHADSNPIRHPVIPNGSSVVIESGERDSASALCEENRNSTTGKRKRLKRWFTKVKKWVCR